MPDYGAISQPSWQDVEKGFQLLFSLRSEVQRTKGYAFTSLFAAAALKDLFEHPEIPTGVTTI